LEPSETEVTAVAEADWARDGALENESDCESAIYRRLWTTLPSTHEVPKPTCLSVPIEHFNPRGRESANRQLRFDLTN
jgi:hypothetical protein